MRIIDRDTNQEITNPDLTKGELQFAIWASPEAYATIDNITKLELDDSDYEEVQLYIAWTADEIAQREEAERQQERQELMDALPDAVADLSIAFSGSASDMQDFADALAELSEIVSGLIE